MIVKFLIAESNHKSGLKVHKFYVMKYNEFNLGQVEAVFNKLGGSYGVHRFLRGDTFVQAKPREFKVWRSITVGNHQEDLIDEVFYSGKFEQTENFPKKKKIYGIQQDCVEVLHSDLFKIYPTECEIDLVVASPSQLGFYDGAPAKEIYSWAKQLGLKLCFPEVGIQLCLQPEKEPVHGLVAIAMEPISLEGRGGFPYIYQVRMNEELQLGYCSGEFIPETTGLVFELPRKIN